MKKQKHFYHNLISIEDIKIELNSINLSKEERKELHLIAESTIHCHLINVVLEHLPEGDKKTFLHHVNTVHHKTTLNFLKKRIENIEDKIKQTAESLKKEFLEDIRKIK